MYWLKKKLAEGMMRRSLKERDLSLEELETRHSDPENPLFNDSSYFLGRGEDGSSMVVRMAFRGAREPEYWLAFHLPGLGSFHLKDLDCKVDQGFKMGNLEFSCQVPGKQWLITYSGSIEKDGKAHQLDLDLVFEGTRPLVNFKHISKPSDIAPVLASENWTKDFLQKLKEIKKVHLEQGGSMGGTITIDGKEHAVNWRSIRDHSWGSRSWLTWKRHVWLGGVLDNGEAFNLSMISYDYLGQLSAGYITQGDELTYFSVLPSMDSFASTQLIPKKVVIEFTSRDGVIHKLEVSIPRSYDFTMDGAYFIREGMGDFVLDGIPGMGVAEFGLNLEHYDYSSFESRH